MDERPEPWKCIRLDDVELEFIERGRGEAVFLVHAGLFSDWFRFVAGSRRLDGFHVVRLRRAGYGRFQPMHHLTLADHARHAAALADRLELERIHWVGHSSSCQIGLALAIERPELVGSLILLEPAAAGGFDVPASVALHPFLGQALAAFQAGEPGTAFDSFMRGVCGEDYRQVLEDRLGKNRLEDAIRESAFFFRDEIGAVREWEFGPTQAAGIRQPVLCIEGGAQPPHLASMSHQISERAVELLPQTEVLVIPSVNHALPLQDPEAVAEAIGSFVDGLSRKEARRT